ncbi:MAG: GNAT family N-acetyltransferase, partial [Vitreimonas sp.]
NWTVWLRDTGAPLGMIEATVDPACGVAVAYLFDPRVWRRGYAREATAAMIAHLSARGARAFEATIDVRNEASRALVTALGFTHVRTHGIDETWRLPAV